MATKNEDTELKDHIRAQVLLSSASALLVGVAYIALPPLLTIGPRWLLLAIAACIVVPLVYTNFFRPMPQYLWRSFRFFLQGVQTVALIGSLILLLTALPHELQGSELIRSAAFLWLSNVLVFAGWYWEVDGDGPLGRHKLRHQAADFQFPQQQDHNPQQWKPGFIDYLFLSFCSATALSPADTLPLTQRAKLLMMVEALISMVTLVLVIGRSVNII